MIDELEVTTVQIPWLVVFSHTHVPCGNRHTNAVWESTYERGSVEKTAAVFVFRPLDKSRGGHSNAPPLAMFAQ
jgi:hypothetical protein